MNRRTGFHFIGFFCDGCGDYVYASPGEDPNVYYGECDSCGKHFEAQRSGQGKAKIKERKIH